LSEIGREETDVQMKFDAPADLRKWPSLNNERISSACPYLVSAGTLDEYMREFLSKPASSHHLYEMHTAAESELISAVLTAEQIVEIARLRDFL
jgi:hypothetical protein